MFTIPTAYEARDLHPGIDPTRFKLVVVIDAVRGRAPGVRRWKLEFTL
ncbi:MAG: hypothetical protein SFY80_14035 [Verrucomicrobiota bacterium]|nr:hypothetical protein [Verrucomicrobiota bacterium]